MIHGAISCMNSVSFVSKVVTSVLGIFVLYSKDKDNKCLQTLWETWVAEKENEKRVKIIQYTA